MPLGPALREAILHLFFGEHWTIAEIADELDLSERTVRRVIVIDGGTRCARRSGPYAKESPS